MKLVIAPQAFKGSLTGMQAARAMEEGARRVFPQAEMVLVPVADGGDGTLEVLVEHTGGRLLSVQVTGPLGEPVQALWGVMGDGTTAVVEMARASGLALLSPQYLDPRITTTYGTGQLVRHALEQGCQRLILGLGGSATNDGGAGMAEALGVRLLDAQGHQLPRGGAALQRLARIELSGLDPCVKELEVVAAADVTNPLTGPEGASLVYGPQKGASLGVARELDRALAHYAEVIQRDLGVDVTHIPGAGAAGGLGAGLLAFLGATIRPGIDLVCELLGLDERLERAHLVLTGEGRIDGSTVFNKAPIGVAQRAKARDIPVLAVTGSLGPGYAAVYQHGIDVVACMTEGGIGLAEALERAYELVQDTTERALRLLLLKGKVSQE
ncbi:MAG: glycerate kinase [Dehalococcoidia bacterium]